MSREKENTFTVILGVFEIQSCFSFLFSFLQLESLQGEAEKLQDDKPEEAQIIREKIAEINNVWMDLKDMVTFSF